MHVGFWLKNVKKEKIAHIFVKTNNKTLSFLSLYTRIRSFLEWSTTAKWLFLDGTITGDFVCVCDYLYFGVLK